MTKKKVVKKPVKRVKNPLTLRQVLDVIDGVLAKDDSTAKSLWHVLTALRGPDDFNDDRKVSTTCPIRCAAFPKAASRAGIGYGYVNGAMFFEESKDTLFAEIGKSMWDKTHFECHLTLAARALGLTNE